MNDWQLDYYCNAINSKFLRINKSMGLWLPYNKYLGFRIISCVCSLFLIVIANTRKTTTAIKFNKKIKSYLYIQAHLLAPTQGRPLRKQKSLNFANAQILLNLNGIRPNDNWENKLFWRNKWAYTPHLQRKWVKKFICHFAILSWK